MRFFRQTLLSVCLILPFAVFAQPIANNDLASTDEDTNVVFDIVGNDTDATFTIDPSKVDLDVSTPLVIDNSFTSPEGQFSVDALGVVTFVPASNFNGEAILSYTVQNTNPSPQTSNQATITVTVNAVNDVPTFTKGADQNVNEDAGVQSVAGWATGIDDSDPEVQTLTFNVSNDNNAMFSVQPAINAAGTLSYTPAANTNGSALVTVTLSDNGSGVAPNVNTSAAQTFTINIAPINDAPVFTKGANQSVAENSPAQSVAGWASGMSDGDPELTQTLTFTVTNDNNPLFTVQPSINAAGTLSYTPATDAIGSALVTVTLSDNGSGAAPNVNTSAPQTFTITINSINNAPVFTKGADQNVNEDAGVQSVAGWATGIDDGDPEVQTLTFNVSNDNNAIFSVLPAINPAGTLSYTPAANTNGSALVTVTLSDNGSGVSPNVNTSAAQTFTINIAPINDAPVFTKGANQSVAENSPAQSVAGWASGMSDGDPELTQTLTFTVTNDNNPLFTVQPSINAAGTLSYTPATDAIGSALVTVTLSDNGSGAAPNVNTSAPQTFTITINSINNAPVFTKGADQNINEDAGVQSVAGWATGIDDGDPEVQTLTFNVSNDNNAMFSVLPAINPAGTLSYTPAANTNGSALVTVTLSDNGSGVAPNVNTSAAQTFTINIAPINDAPVFTKGANQSVAENSPAQTVAGWASGMSDGDPELTQTLTFIVTNDNNPLFTVQPSINAAGTLSYTPATDAIGSALVTVTLSDNGSGAAPNVNTSAAQTFTITINSINNAPVFTKGADQNVNEDAGVQTVAGWATGIDDGDPEVQTLTFNVSNDNNAMFSVLPAINPAGTLSYTPAANANGSALVTVTLSDNGSGVSPNVNTSAAQTFTINIAPINDAPAFTKGANQSVAENSPAQSVAGWAIGISDGDPELTQTLTFTATNDNNSLFTVQPSINAAGTLSYTPATDAIGSALVTVTLSDNGSGSAPNVNSSAAQTFTISITEVNDPPTISSISNQVIDEDTQTGALAFTINDDETPPGSLTVTRSTSNTTLIPLANIVLGGSGANRAVTITPVANLSGSATITVTVSDGVNSTPTNFLVTVTPVDDTPTISSIANQSIPENTQTGLLPFNVGDVETPANLLTLTKLSSNTVLVTNSNVVLGGAGSLRNVNVIPTINQIGTTTITLTVSDGAKTAQTAFQVLVTAVDSPPTITPISDQVINEDAATGVLAFTIDDPDTGPGSLTVTAVSDNTALVPDVNINLGGSGADRTVQVTPLANQNGVANITITVSDGVETAVTSFQVTVTAINDVPTITAISDQVIVEDTPTGAIGFTVGDVETAAGALNLSGTSSDLTLVPNGNIVFGGSGASRSVTVTPAPGQSGNTTITVNVTDGVATTPEVFQLTVTADNDVPTITAISDQVVNEDTPTGAIAFTVGDPETPAGSLTVTGGSNNTTLVPNANIVFGGSGAARTVTVTPASNQSGNATITINVSDGTNSTPEIFLLTVNNVNDLPTITAISDQNINEDAPAGTGILAFTVGDVETPAGSLTVTRTSSNLVLMPLANVVLGGSGASRTVIATPAPNQFGTTTITLTVNDGTTTVNTDFVVNVASVNDAPTITLITDQIINENTSTGALGFTIGDVETAVGSLSVTRVSSNTTLVPLANVVLGGSGANRTVTVTPATNQFGSTNITITIGDGTTTTDMAFQVTVNAVNDPPTITPIADQVVNEDVATGALAFTISDQETAAGSLILSATSSNTTLVPNLNIAFGGSGGSRTVTVTPAPNQFGVTTITVNVSDGVTVVPEIFSLTVNSVNDLPTISAVANQNINEDAPAGTGVLAFTIGDVETAATSLTVTRTSSNLVLVPLANVVLGGSDANRTVIVTPAPNQFGSTTITLTVSDGTATVNTNFTVNVASVNDDPTITVIADQIINENTSTGALGFTIGDVETPVGSLSVTRASSNSTLVPLANIVLGGSGANRTVTVTPAPNQFGAATITVTVGDGTSTTPTSFELTVNAVNDPPTISAIADQVINEDFSTGALAFTISDPETAAGSLILTAISSNTALVPNLNITFGGSGGARTVTVTPVLNQSGTTIITVNVSDGVTVVPEVFQVTVNAVNDAPTVTTIANQTINEDTQTGNLAFTVGDAETPAASLIVTASSSNTTLVPNANITLGGSGPSRTVNVIPVVNLSGVTTITINVSDGSIVTPMTFQVTVNAVDDAPTITAIANQTVAEDSPTGALAFTIGDLDTPVGTLTITPSSSNTTLVPIANIVIGGSGASRTVTVTPAANQTGVTTITLTVSDGTITTPTNFDVTVTPVNDPPTITTITNRTINEDSQTGTINFTIGDAETAAAALIVTGVSSNTTLVPNANIVLGGTGTSRTVQVIPAANQFGVTTITLSVNDGTVSVPTNFTVTVNAINDAPLITNQVPITINEVQPIVLSLAQLTVVDPDNNYPADFSLFVLGGANYSVVGTTVTPVANFSGTLVVPVFVNDGALSSPFYNLQISVNSTNDPPVITNQQTLSMNEDQTIALTLANLVVTDPDNNYPADFTLTVLPPTLPGTYTFTGNTVTPALNFNGTLTVRVKVNDGSIDSAPYNLQITVNPVNDPPVITAQSPLSTNEDTPILLVIGNFTVADPEPGTHTLIVAPAPGVNYTVSGNTVTPNLNFSGTLSVPVTVSDGALTSVSFNAQIQVVPVNDAPVITGQTSLSTVEDIPLTILLSNLTVTDVDNTYPTGFTLTILAGTNYTFSGTTITPVLDFVGTITVNVRVNDGTTNSATFPLQVQVTDDADAPVITGQNPVSVNEDASRAIILADLIWEDPDTPGPQMTVTVLPGTNYNITGNTITPIANFFGTLSVNVRINDGVANSNTYPLQVSVVSVNDPPSFNSISSVVLLEDAALQTLTITGITPGPLETQLLQLTVVSDNTALIPQPAQTPAYNGTATSAVISFKPEPNAFGTATITVRITDTDLVEFIRTFTITVTPVNDTPTLTSITVAPIVEDAPEQIIPLTGISVGGGLAESGQVLTFIPSTDKPELFELFEVVYVSPQATGSLRIKPKPNANGTAQITLRLQDDGSGTAPNANFIVRTFTLVITPVNDLPVFISEPLTIAEPGQPYVYAIDVIDVDGQVITITAPTKPAWLTLTQGTNGKATLSGTPPVGATGDISIVIEAKDPSLVVVPQGYTLTINSRPVLSPVTVVVQEDTEYGFKASDFAAGFADSDGNTLSELQITKLPKRGDLKFGGVTLEQASLPFKIDADELSSLTYTPRTDSTGRDTLRWNASDGFLLYSLADTYAVLDVSTTNDPPIISFLETDTLKYELGSEVPIFLTPAFDGYDPDGDNIARAEIRIENLKFRAENEELIFTATPKITGDYDEDAGVLTLLGTATAKEYVDAIRSIKYNYTDAKELLLDSRNVYISLNDGLLESAQKARIVTLVYTFSDLDIPTAFTPNGDRANETWVITSPNGTEQYSNAEVKVYDKRGMLLFKSIGFEQPWNGVWNGELLPSDTYFYTIELNYNKVLYRGTVTILR